MDGVPGSLRQAQNAATAGRPKRVQLIILASPENQGQDVYDFMIQKQSDVCSKSSDTEIKTLIKDNILQNSPKVSAPKSQFENVHLCAVVAV